MREGAKERKKGGEIAREGRREEEYLVWHPSLSCGPAESIFFPNELEAEKVYERK